MHTVFDWVTVAIFAGLVLLLLQRSVAPEPSDKLWQYLPPAIGCAAANALGNNGYALVSAAILVLSLVYIFYVLKPLPTQRH
jgi:hypothetical protein